MSGTSPSDLMFLATKLLDQCFGNFVLGVCFYFIFMHIFQLFVMLFQK